MDINAGAIKETVVNFIIPLISLVASISLGVIVFYPSFKALPRLKDEKETKETLSTTLDSKLTTLNKLLDYQSVVEENSTLVKDVLVEEASVPELLTQIDLIATESGLVVDKMNYSFSDLGKAPTSSGTEGVSDATNTSYKMINVTMGAKGNVEQLVTFFKNLENAARLIDVDSFRYSSQDADQGQFLSVTFDLKSPYLFVESTAVTDDAVTLDITDNKFVDMINRIKGMKFYRISIDNINTELVKESSESTPSEDNNEEDSSAGEDNLNDNPFGLP